MTGLTGFCVALEAQHDLRRSVPSRCNVFCHVSSILIWIYAETSSQTKVGDLEFAVGVYQQITRFQISVKDVGAVNILETAKYLVDEGLEVGVCEGLS